MFKHSQLSTRHRALENYIAIYDGLSGDNYILMYNLQNDTLSEIVNLLPSVSTGTAGQLAFSPNSQFLARAGNNVAWDYLQLWKRNKQSWTLFSSSLSAIPPALCKGVDFSDDGMYLACTPQTSPRIYIYKWSGTGWTKLSDPSTLPANNCNGVAWAAGSGFV